MAPKQRAKKPIEKTVALYRGKYYFNGKRFGLVYRCGPYETKAEAIEAALDTQAKARLGQILKEPEIATLNAWEIAQEFLKSDEHRVKTGKIKQSTFDDIMRSIGAVQKEKTEGGKEVKYYELGGDGLMQRKLDGKAIKDLPIAPLGTKLNRGAVCDEIEAQFMSICDSRSTLSKRIKTSKKFFSFCVQKGYIDSNPLSELKVTFEKTVDNRAKRIMTEHILKLVRDGLPAEKLVYRAAIETSLNTGMRQGECRALPWRNVDFENNVIHIRQAVDHDGNLSGTKTKYGDRVVAVDERLMRLLRELRLQQRCSGDDDFVFAKINGDWQNSETLRQAFKRACRRAEIPVLLWSDMRHYFASSQINELGEAWNNIADDMGHHSADFTRTQYRHYLDNSEKQETTRTIARKSIYGSD